jgi:hypothetical protein
MWWQIALNVAVLLVSSLLYKPPPGPRAQSAKDVAVPKSEEGAPIYDGAGTFWVDDAHVVWSGDFDSEGIYKRGGKK